MPGCQVYPFSAAQSISSWANTSIKHKMGNLALTYNQNQSQLVCIARGTVTLGEAVADAIAALKTDEEKETVVIFGGPLLLDGLLDAASVASRSPAERAAAERALASLLSAGGRDLSLLIQCVEVVC